MDQCTNFEINESESSGGSNDCLQQPYRPHCRPPCTPAGRVHQHAREGKYFQEDATESDADRPELTLLCLPYDAILYILSWVDIGTLLRLACVNKHFKKLAYDDAIWRMKTLTHFGTVVERKSPSHIHWKSIYKAARNWYKGNCREKESILFAQCMHLLPWLQISHNENLLAVSQGSDLYVYDIKKKKLRRSLTLKGHSDDIVRFVKHGSNVFTSSIDKTVRVWQLSDRRGYCKATLKGHTKGVYCVDGDNNVIVSGSKDETIKIWKNTSYWNYRWSHTVDIRDHIWCVCLNSNVGRFLCGTAAYNDQDTALRVYDLQTGQQLTSLGTHRIGAGILELKLMDSYTALSCGYDTTVRLWDIRSNQNVQTWEDPHDNVVYCVDSNKDNMIISGTSRYGVVRLWDKRMTQPIQSYFTGKNRRSSPVYSLQFSATKLFVALSHSVRMLDFS